MSTLLALGGWLVAACGLGFAVLIRCQLVRHLDGVARACHELRGPITAARLGLELGFRIRQLPVSRLRAIELELDRASLALEDLSQRRPGSRALGSETVDLAELAAYSVEAWRPLAIACGAGVRLDRPRGDWVVVGDRLRLAQALGNLIANGIEHGGGGVDVRLRAQPGRIRIEVVDRGAGLPAPLDELARRRRAGWTLRSPERGHGLAIASSIAADHGGRLAASPSQSGARLVLELPASADGSGRT